MKKGLGVLVIIIGICLLLGPAAHSLYEHGLEYGWDDVFKILLTILKLVLFFAFGAIFFITGVFIFSDETRKGWINIIKTIRGK